MIIINGQPRIWQNVVTIAVQEIGHGIIIAFESANLMVCEKLNVLIEY